MLLDKELMFSEEQAVTDDAVSTNVVDTGALAEIGGFFGKPIQPVLQIANSFTSSSATFQATLEASDVADDFDPCDTLWQSPAVAASALKAGYKFAPPPLPPKHKRYLRFAYAASTLLAAGKVTAGLVMDDQSNGAAVAKALD